MICLTLVDRLYYHSENEVPDISTGRTWDLLYLFTLRDLKLRYQDTILGFLWSLMKPLALGVVLSVALQTFVRIEVNEPYHLILLTALFPWVWFQTSVLLATASFAVNGALIKKVQFPRYILPFATVLNNGLHFLLTVPILIILLAIDGRYPDATWLIGIPMLAALQLALLMGIILIVASLNVFFRDLEHLVEVLLTLLFYLSPILYPLSKVPERWHPLLQINPMTSLVEAWRGLFMNNTLPGTDIWPALLFAAASLVMGILIFRRLDPGFADAL